MASKSLELLLLQTVEGTGIVGDIVRVKAGFARNYLLPHGLAEFPTAEKIEALKEERAKAQAELTRLRAVREELIKELENVEISVTRSCNDQGVLYGSVTQRDIADTLTEAGYGVDVRSVRLPQAIRHIGPYTVPIQFDKDLRTEISIIIEPDQPLEEREEMEFDDEGNLVEKPKPQEKAEDTAKPHEPAPAAAPTAGQ